MIGVNCTDAVAGRIEICDGTEWRAVCENGWHRVDARVVCHQLGFTTEGISFIWSQLEYVFTFKVQYFII